jgi:hypothetical protein
LLKSYTNLSYISVCGISCALLGGFLLIGYDIDLLSTGRGVEGDIKILDIKQLLGFLGIAMFSFEGNGVILNLRAEAKN